jgi:hypothetical protein
MKVRENEMLSDPASSAEAKVHAGALADCAAVGGDGQRRPPRWSQSRTKHQVVDVTSEVLEQVDPIYFGDLRRAAFKALGLT